MEKTVAESATEQIQILMPADINGAGRLFGGKLMEWIDVVAAVVARRHSGHDVTTACVDTLVFGAPAHANQTLTLKGRVTYVGRTSIEVRVETFIEDLDGERHSINKAYLVLVAIDEHERPVEVPRLKLLTDEDRTEWENGERRRELRRKRRAEHLI
ncbi:MAG: acyl-CoA thioesterase [Clostridia bacterium]|jgi:acyl-CoA hydrolase|nr:acyl-CoA thioesterase [Clostridia bacterium]